MTYLTPAARLDAAAARAQHLRQHLTADCLDALFEALTGRPVTDPDYIGRTDAHGLASSEAAFVHLTVHASGAVCCAAFGYNDYSIRSKAHGPLSCFAVDLPAAVDLADLADLPGQSGNGDDTLERGELVTRERQRTAVLRLLHLSCAAASTTGFTKADMLEHLWEATVALTDPQRGPERQMAVRRLIAGGSLSDADLPELMATVTGITA